jgi:2-keto-4-pentenoate hydratase/2-oxohepta-3-ene-1,7-dioic acid hydratase in catechol pathway
LKLFRFNGGRIGVTTADGSFDLTEALAVDPAAWPPVQMVQLIARFDALIGPALAQSTGRRIDPQQARLDVPIAWPNKVLAFPANYRAHQAEMNSRNQADVNGFFLKANSSLSGPNDPIVLPDLPGRDIHHECELGIVIGKRCRKVPREDALSCIFGYACLIDMVVRGHEERVMRKSWDSFCPFGPWIVTADEVPDPGCLETRLWVNEELRQQANTRDLILDIPGMIALASRVATLEPGDIVATGTPAGVGPVKPGDTVRIWIERVGEMRLNAVAEA